ncbi:low temperature requirement protein A [Nonomuraea soli]|uniref:Low temperature requirement protein LtrA n=1 Tax=Nonomuraea soli TaxID=1032476 RepID=A0A7W0CTS2_9ACTN|nr:low temperature requirement protein A [Nonomuraea soli]MBA2897048.1 low temperature requirement protein LtrA [Nonomuraea soli]
MTVSGERHASWLELFFDLVVVVAVVQLAHRLHEPTLGSAIVTFMLFYAIWSVWISYTLYANVVADRVRTRSVLVGMFGMGVMAAAVPGVDHRLPEVQDTRDFAFALAYVICRMAVGGTLRRAGTVVTSWPAVQLGRGLALGPWIASLFLDPPLTYQLWFIGIVFDVLISVRRSRHPDRIMTRIRKRELQHKSRERATLGALDISHLEERLGLFVIIVLGEAVMQVVVGASATPWDFSLGLTALAAFAMVVALWWLAFQYGVSSAPLPPGHRPRPAALLPAHFVMTGGIAALAAGLGVSAEHPDSPLPGGVLTVMCLGLTATFAASTLLGATAGAERRWTWAYALPTTLLPLVVGVFGLGSPGWIVVTLLLLGPLWRIRYRPRALSPSP